MKKIKSSIIIFNIFSEKGDFQLSINELYFYALLRSLESKFLNRLTTTLNLLMYDQMVYKDKNQNRNVNNIKKIINSLIEKKVIVVNFDDKINANTKLDITFPFLDGGFEHIYMDSFQLARTPDELFILIQLIRFKEGYQCSKENWSNILGYNSKNTGYEIISKMERDKIIYSIEGEYFKDNQGRIKQKPTKWFIVKDNSEIEMSNIKEPELKEVLDKSVSEESLIPKYIELEISQGINSVSRKEKFSTDEIRHQINNWGSKLYYQHYYYSHKFKIIEPDTYKMYLKRLEKIGSGYSTTSYEIQFNEEMKRERIKEEKKLELTKNAVDLYGSDDKVYVTGENIDDIDFDNIYEIFYDYNGALNQISLYKIANAKFESIRDLSKEKYDYIVDAYKKIVRTGKMVTISDLQNIREGCKAL
jgi:hypothetical protein